MGSVKIAPTTARMESAAGRMRRAQRRRRGPQRSTARKGARSHDEDRNGGGWLKPAREKKKLAGKKSDVGIPIRSVAATFRLGLNSGRIRPSKMGTPGAGWHVGDGARAAAARGERRRGRRGEDGRRGCACACPWREMLGSDGWRTRDADPPTPWRRVADGLAREGVVLASPCASAPRAALAP